MTLRGGPCRRLRRALMPAILASGFLSPLSAQVRGTVIDPTGKPLADVVVDLWTHTARIGRVVTGPTGRFSFAAAPPARQLTVRRIGSLPTRLDVSDGLLDVKVTLVPGPLTIESLRVDGGCTTKEDRAAVGRWRRAAAMYRPLPDSLYVASEVKLVAERLPLDEVGRPSADSSGYGWTMHHLATTTERELEARVKSLGWPVPDPEAGWGTGSLDEIRLEYLASAAFLRDHRLTLEDESTLRFCPRDRHYPWIEGELKLGEDGSLLWARWQYGSPASDPGTGGLAIFLAPAADSSRSLLPSTDLLWQVRTDGMAAQRTIDYREWRVTREEPHWRP